MTPTADNDTPATVEARAVLANSQTKKKLK